MVAFPLALPMGWTAFTEIASTMQLRHAPPPLPAISRRAHGVLRRFVVPRLSCLVPARRPLLLYSRHPIVPPSATLGARSTASSDVHLSPSLAPDVLLGARSPVSSAVHLSPNSPASSPSVLLGARSPASSSVHLSPSSTWPLFSNTFNATVHTDNQTAGIGNFHDLLRPSVPCCASTPASF
jgi:hypothetical protein